MTGGFALNMNLLPTRAVNAKWIRRFARWLLVICSAVVLYILSIGPVFRANAGRVMKSGVPPRFVQVFYAPLFMPGQGFINLSLDRYVMWCIGNDYTRGVSAVCEIHRTPMTKTTVPIEYGLFRPTKWSEVLIAASANNFPHAEKFVLGGCIEETPTQAIVYSCKQCQTARSEWETAHQPPREVANE